MFYDGESKQLQRVKVRSFFYILLHDKGLTYQIIADIEGITRARAHEIAKRIKWIFLDVVGGFYCWIGSAIAAFSAPACTKIAYKVGKQGLKMERQPT